MKTMKLIATMMTLSMLAAAFAGCLGGDDDDETTTVKIGFLNPITGPLEQNAPVFKWSADEAISDLNEMYPDYNFELIEQDSGCDGDVATPAAQTLADSGVYAVVGAACSGASMAANAVLSAAGIPMISYASTNPGLSDADAYPMFYRNVPSDAIQGPAGADMMTDAGVAEGALAVFGMTNDYGAGLADSVVDAWGSDKLCDVGRYDYPDTQTDFNDIATQMAASTECTAVYLSSYIKDAQAIIEALDDAGWDGHIFGGDGPAGEGMYDGISDAALLEGMTVTIPRAGSSFGDFSAHYDANAPSGGIKAYDLTTYDGVMMVGMAAVNHNGVSADEGIAATGNGYEGASGVINFLDNGDIGGNGYDICTYDGVDDDACSKYWTAEGGVATA
ncbi:MAG: ABC transporter substrate-binding protein [Candidatus Thalassarchaeaceae archaeon]